MPGQLAAPPADCPRPCPHLTPLMEETEKVQLEGPSCKKKGSQRRAPGSKRGLGMEEGSREDTLSGE